MKELSYKNVGFLQNLKSRIAWLFSFQDIDEHYVAKFCGLKFCKKHGFKVEFKEVTALGITEQKRNPKVIVSLTTFPARINTVYKTVSTLLEQTLKPDEVVLWLADEQFPNRELPENLTRLQQYGLTIKWCEDIKSYKKLIPTLKEYPNDIIVTFDDDYYYDKDVLKNLYEEHEKYPNCIIGTRAVRLIHQRNNKLKSIKRSYVYNSSYLPSYLNMFVGYGGVLYPPNTLNKDILDSSKFMKLIPTNDDAWFWLNGIKNKTKFVAAKDGYKIKLYPVENSQNVGLYQINRNDSTAGLSGEHAVNMFVEMYPEIKETINS